MKLLKYLIIFLLFNFGALAIGTWLMDNGPKAQWYLSLNKAPWTPDGWIFGAAWTTIMVCYSVYMTFLYLKDSSTKVKILFLIQFALNVFWNFVFFNQHLIYVGLLNIILLTIIISKFFFDYRKVLNVLSVLILPYLIWLCIATSLNLYIVIYN